MEKRYQVFVSSTYEDLQQERKEVMQALLELDCIPAGMELFPASNDDQWSLIKRVIDGCDYYLLIIGGRYGSTNEKGISYTQMEFEYALQTGKPIISFIHKNPDSIPSGKVEKSEAGKEKLQNFKNMVQKKLVRYWETPSDLGSVVSRSMVRLIKDFPAEGWIRASQLPLQEKKEIEIDQQEKRAEIDVIPAQEQLIDFRLFPNLDQRTKDELEFSSLVNQIPDVKKAFSGNPPQIYDKPVFCEWKEKIKYHLRKMRQDAAITELLQLFDAFNGWADAQLFPSVAAKCRVIRDKYDSYTMPPAVSSATSVVGKKVFIVHGHDSEAKVDVARTLEKLGFDVVILHEQPNHGMTIIEKLETNIYDAAFAIVLYTECDIGRPKDKTDSANQFRARQNVVLEHGLFLGRLGRDRVCALVKGNIEIPSDLSGVLYITMDDSGSWKMQLCKNLRAAGLEADANKII